MARTPATPPRLASLCLLVAATVVVLHADAQRDCTGTSQACVESDVCTECTSFTSTDSYVDCLVGIGAEIGSCEYTEQQACCLNEVSGIDCVSDPVTFEFFECLYDPTEACDGGWTCSGDTTNGGDTTPAPATASGTNTPVTGGGGGAETTVPAAPTAITTSAGVDDTMAPSATNGGMSPAPTASTTSAGGDDTMAPSPADGDRALDITPAPSSAAAMPSATTTTTSMAGESETMAPTATGDGERDLDVTPSPATGEAGGGSAPTASGADETEAPTSAAGGVDTSAAPTAVGEGEDGDAADTTSGGRGLLSSSVITVGGVVAGLLAFSAATVVV